MDDGLYRYSKAAPLSPWAKRFPDINISYVSEYVNHSILAPEYPRINDPKYYDLDGPPADQQIPKNYKEVDNFLSCEAVQEVQLYNLRTWQAAVLRRHVRFSPDVGFMSGGHRPGDASTKGQLFSALPPPGLGSSFPHYLTSNEKKHFQIYERDRIKVDETKWFSFFRKERWFDWLHISPEFEDMPGRNWTVDDPDIWNHLSLSIELADRMLKALVQDRHDGAPNDALWPNRLLGPTGLDVSGNHSEPIEPIPKLPKRVVLISATYSVDYFGPPPSPDAMVLLSHPVELLLSQSRGEPSCQWDHSELNQYGAMKQGQDCSQLFLVTTHSSQDWKDRLEQLFDMLIWSFAHLDGGVEGQTNVAYVNDQNYPYSAIIVVHIGWFVTMLDTDLALEELCTLQVSLAITIIHELMHAVHRARHHNDNYVGTLTDKNRNCRGFGVPPEPFIDGEGFRENGFCMEHKFFGGCHFRHPHITGNDKYAIPLAIVANEWPWSWSKDEKVPDAKFAKDGYVGRLDHIPSLWISKVLSESFWQDPAFPSKSENFFHRNRIISLEYEIEGGIPRYREGVIVKDPNLLKYKYPEDGHLVRELEERNYQWENYRRSWFFQKKDLLNCMNYARELWERVDESSLASFQNHMPAARLLMEASIPISLRDITRAKVHTGWHHELLPSKEAAAAGNSEMVQILANLFDQKDELGTPRKYVDNHIQGTRTIFFSQFDFLKLIRDVVSFVTLNSALVSLGFLNAILAAAAALEKDRQVIQRNYHSGHHTRWASDWFFKFPEYDPNLSRHENGKWVTQHVTLVKNDAVR
ncbi:hypothetical protein RRF57_000672 [Xylaria bambusicola]|uniref:Uncharacterized protein n=1 Tax=Xylaria bambusicola TaxID=326684 RepID=A0AAN7UEV9_9PEZI